MNTDRLNILLGRAMVWGNLLLASLLILGITVFLEIIFSNHNRTVDLTPGKIFTLSDQTLKVLDSLDADVDLTTFHKLGERAKHEAILTLFKTASPNIKFRLIDLDRNPGKAKVQEVSKDGDTIIEYKGKKKKIPAPTEQFIINAILQMTQDRQKVFYLSKGHGEGKDYTSLAKILIRENWKVEDIYLTEKENIPLEDRTVLTIAGPTKDFLDHEIALLKTYLHKGGKIVLLLEPFVKLPKLEAFLQKYQIRLPQEIIVDQENKLYGGDDLAPIIPYLAKTPFTEGLRSALIFPTARPVRIEEEFSFKISVKSLSSSADHSWAKAGQEGLKEQDFIFREDVDTPGPVPVAVWLTITEKDEEGLPTEGELMCFGDAEFINDVFFNVLGNSDFFLNTISWLARDTNLISIRGNTFEYPYHFLDESQGRLLFWISVIAVPGVFLVIGVITLIFRRVKG